MAIVYDKIGYESIEKELLNLINDEFSNVYVSPKFRMIGNSCIRINLKNSTNVGKTNTFEEREYLVSVRYYFRATFQSDNENIAIKGKIDRLKKHLLDNQTKSDKWSDLVVDDISYDIHDDENDDENDLYIAEFDLTIRNYNQFITAQF